jgi:uncharacterized protein
MSLPLARRPAFGLLWKTVSEDCNLACDYCYYSHVAGRPAGVRVPAPDLLEHVLRDYVTTCGGWASVVWQGGEPLMAGLPFFQRVVALEAQYAPRGTVLSNAVQTNGVLINDAWAQFFATYRFFVGVSLDGPEAMHDARRVDAAGRGTFRRVRSGLEYLRQRSVAFNVLTVVGPHNVNRGTELVDFYRAERLEWVQFLPEMAFHAQRPNDPGRYAITPQQYGDFLCTVFDGWYQDGHPDFHVRFFDDVLQGYLHQTPEICTMQAQCPPRLVVEVNGDLYPCDFYLDPSWKLGNARRMPLREALRSPVYNRFQALKPAVPQMCRTCPWWSVCRGGCPRNREGMGTAEAAPDYFCAAFQKFFAYADGRLRRLAERLRGPASGTRRSAPL